MRSIVISNYTLENPAYLHFYLIAASAAFISAAIGFRVFHIWKLDLEPKISLDISSKWNSMLHTPLYGLVERTPSF